MMAVAADDVMTILLEYVCPIVGVILAILTFSAPSISVREALQDKSLGSLNPMPWIFMTGNCLGWTGYSFLTKNIYVFLPNAVGLVVSIWLNLSALQVQFFIAANEEQEVHGDESYDGDKNDIYFRLSEDPDVDSAIPFRNENHMEGKDIDGDNREFAWDRSGEVIKRHQFQSSQHRRRHRNNKNNNRNSVGEVHMRYTTGNENKTRSVNIKQALILIVLLWLVIFSIIALVSLDHGVQKNIIGIVGNFNLAFFYGAPLSTMSSVVSDGSSSSIHRPTLVLNTLNSSFWTAYGFFIYDPFIFVPNTAGVLLGLFQVILCLCYPKDGRNGGNDGDEEHNDLTQPLTSNLL